MAVLGLGQKPIVMPSYPHMLSADSAVWTRFLKDPIGDIKEVWYDVHVGKAVRLPGGADETDHRIADGLTRKRIDVVCRVGGGLWVVEIKPEASAQAVGQVLSYTAMFLEEFEPPGEVVSVIICDHPDVDLVDRYEDFGVSVISNF